MQFDHSILFNDQFDQQLLDARLNLKIVVQRLSDVLDEYFDNVVSVEFGVFADGFQKLVFQVGGEYYSEPVLQLLLFEQWLLLRWLLDHLLVLSFVHGPLVDFEQLSKNNRENHDLGSLQHEILHEFNGIHLGPLPTQNDLKYIDLSEEKKGVL